MLTAFDKTRTDIYFVKITQRKGHQTVSFALGYESEFSLHDRRMRSWVSEEQTSRCDVCSSGVAQSTSFEARLCLAHKTTCDGDWRENFNYLFPFCLIYYATGEANKSHNRQPTRRIFSDHPSGWLLWCGYPHGRRVMIP